MTTTDIIKFSLQERKMIHMHTHTHTQTHHLTRRGVQTVCTCNIARHCAPKSKKQKGGVGCQLNQLPGPAWDFLSLFKKKRVRGTHDLLFLCSATLKNTRWMWSRRDFLLYRIKNQATAVIHLYRPAVSGVVQSRSWNGGFYYYYHYHYVHAAHKQLH